MTEPISNEDLAGWREPGGEYEAVYAMIARIDAAEAEVARLREALEDLSTYTGELWYGTPNLVGKLEQIVRHVRSVLGAALAAPPDQPTVHTRHAMTADGQTFCVVDPPDPKEPTE